MTQEALQPNGRFELKSGKDKVETPVLDYLREEIYYESGYQGALETLDRAMVDIITFASYPHTAGRPIIKPLPRFDNVGDLKRHIGYFARLFNVLEENPEGWILTEHASVKIPKRRFALAPIIEIYPSQKRYELYFEKSPSLARAA